MLQSRRDFLKFGALPAAAFLLPKSLRAEVGKHPRILLLSDWQMTNIGHIAHTPGMLALLEKFLPEAEVTLWINGSANAEIEMLEAKRFPHVTAVSGKIGRDGRCSTPELSHAVSSADLLLHGSRAGFAGRQQVADFVNHVGKPFGVFGITYGGGSDADIALLSQAHFLYFRETVSLAQARRDGIASPIMGFSPDTAFACDYRNDTAAEAYLQSVHLEPGKFLCCIPRLRYTPHWLFNAGGRRDDQKEARNVAMKEHDHAPLRDAIITVVRETGVKILLCPEDVSQMAVGKEMIYDRLPRDVCQHVVWREKFWLTDLALSVYTQSLGVFGLEMHSPVLCIGAGVPALVGWFKEQTSKGFMWNDIGLGDWLFDMDQPGRVAEFPSAVLRFVQDRPAVLNQVRAAQGIIQQRHSATMQEMRHELTKA